MYINNKEEKKRRELRVNGEIMPIATLAQCNRMLRYSIEHCVAST
jgi:hypothetical protein